MAILFYTFIFVFGTIIGSFLNCLIWRLHKKESLWGRSYCPHCRKHIAWYDNIPIASYLILRAKCRRCRKRISWQYPAVEVITVILFVVAYAVNHESRFPIYDLRFTIYDLRLLRDWLIISVMTVIFVYDLRWYLILDIVTLPSIVIVFFLNIALGFDLWELLISGIIGGSFFLLQFVISRGKWIGGGDIRLGFLMGVILGWPNILTALFIAYLLGSVIGVGLILANKKKWGSRVPFGVFLTSATIITLFYGESLLRWYLNLIL